MEASSNSRDGSSSISLQLSVEQWELLRRLRNSHLTKQQIIRAYDELDRLDRELGNLFNSTTVPPPSSDPISPSTIIHSQISPSSSNNNHKRSHSQTMINGTNSRTSSTTSNGYHLHTTSPNLHNRPGRNNGVHDLQPTNMNQYEALNSHDLEEENRELQELLSYVLFQQKKIVTSKNRIRHDMTIG